MKSIKIDKVSKIEYNLMPMLCLTCYQPACYLQRTQLPWLCSFPLSCYCIGYWNLYNNFISLKQALQSVTNCCNHITGPRITQNYLAPCQILISRTITSIGRSILVLLIILQQALKLDNFPCVIFLMLSVAFQKLHKIALLLSMLLKQQVGRVPSLAIGAHLPCFTS